MIKLIALVAMTLDHIGFYFFPGVLWIRLIGRMAMPLFAHELARGIERTTDIKRYIKRLLITAVIAQIPLFILGSIQLNILFNMALTLVLFKEVERKQKHQAAATLALIVVSPIEYGILFPLTVLLFKVIRLEDRRLNISKWLFYAYYPAHLILISLVKSKII